MQQEVQGSTQVHIIIGALDEHAQRPELTDLLKTVAGWQLENLHVVMTRRKKRDIETIDETYIKLADAVALQSGTPG